MIVETTDHEEVVVATPKSTSIEVNPKPPESDPETPAEISPVTLELNTTDLRRALKVVAALTPYAKRPSLPILEYVYLAMVGGDQLIVRRCDLEAYAQVTITVRLASSLSQEPTVCVSTKALADAIKGLRSPQLRLELGSRSCRILTDGGSLRLGTMDPAEYPTWLDQATHPPLPEELQLGTRLGAAELRELVHATSFSADDRKTLRPIFAALHMQAAERSVEVCCADSFRLSVAQVIPVAGAPNAGFVANIPAWFLDALVPHLPVNATVEFTLLQKSGLGADPRTVVLVACDDLTAYTECISGVYPNYRAFTDVRSVVDVRIIRAVLLNAVTSASAIAQRDGNILRLRLTDTGEHWHLMVHAEADGDEFEQVLPLEPEDVICAVDEETGKRQIGSGIETIYNARYLRDALAATSRSRLTLRISGTGSLGTSGRDPDSDGTQLPHAACSYGEGR